MLIYYSYIICRFSEVDEVKDVTCSNLDGSPCWLTSITWLVLHLGFLNIAEGKTVKFSFNHEKNHFLRAYYVLGVGLNTLHTLAHIVKTTSRAKYTHPNFKEMTTEQKEAK